MKKQHRFKSSRAMPNKLLAFSGIRSNLTLKGNQNIVTVLSPGAESTQHIVCQLTRAYKREIRLLRQLIALTDEVARLKQDHVPSFNSQTLSP
jgi:hypothetical protein